MKIAIPDFALVVLIGSTGAGKSSFARKHFLDTEIVSSDACRAIVCDDETDQSSTADAFDLVRHTAGLRLKRRRLAVIDATSVQRRDREPLIRLARRYHAPAVALVLNIDVEICHERNLARPNRDFGPHVALQHVKTLRQSLKRLPEEGFHQIHIMNSPEEVAALEIVREPLWTDCRSDFGPFDIIGDVHGCFDELTALLGKLGYLVDGHEPGENLLGARHPQGRRAFFVGDLTDRGPRNVDCLRLVMGMCAAGSGLCVIGNHDDKLMRWLKGNQVQIAHGLALTLAELQATSEGFRTRVHTFLAGLHSHAWLAGGRLVVAHAGLKESMHGRASAAVREFAMYGETTGEVDDFGLPVRRNWARGYSGTADVVYGHTPMAEAQWLNNTICIDTGCGFGGRLTALRWPERELVSVDAARQYSVPVKPLDRR